MRGVRATTIRKVSAQLRCNGSVFFGLYQWTCEYTGVSEQTTKRHQF